MCSIQRRYIVVGALFLAQILSNGSKANFAMVMTDLSMVNNTEHAQNIFPNCTVAGTSRDGHVDWSGAEIALLHTAHGIGDTLGQMPFAILCLRFTPRRIVGVICTLIGLMYWILPFVINRSYAATLAMRVILGSFEGGTYPATFGMMTAWVLPSKRMSYVGLVNSGAYFSPVLAFLLSGITTCYVSWSSSLYIYGAWFFLWGIFVLTMVYDSPFTDCHIGKRELAMFEADMTTNRSSLYLLSTVPWKSLLTSLPVIAVMAAAFCRNWVVTLTVTQQPQYFKDSFGQNSATIGLLGCVPHLLMGIVAMSAGFVLDAVIRSKLFTLSAARKLANSLGFGIEAVFMMALYFVESNQWRLAFTFLSVGVGCSGLIVAGYQSDQLTLAPAYSPIIVAYTRVGAAGAIGSTAFVAAIVGNNHDIEDWQKVFLATAIISLFGVVFYAIFSSSHVQPWAHTDERQLLIEGNDSPSLTEEGKHGRDYKHMFDKRT